MLIAYLRCVLFDESSVIDMLYFISINTVFFQLQLLLNSLLGVSHWQLAVNTKGLSNQNVGNNPNYSQQFAELML